MPELPEVEIVKIALEESLSERCVEKLVFNRPNLRFALPVELPSLIEGQCIKSVSRRGKYILVFGQSGAGFVLHLGMSGVIRIEKTLEDRSAQKHDHVEMILDDDQRIVFNDPRRFGFLDMVEEKSWHAYGAFSSMGPEPLGNGFNGRMLFERLQSRKGPIKTVLLDQSIVAGLGNIYVCEALYCAGISPLRPANQISESEGEVLTHSIINILQKAIRAGGSTLKDYRHADGKLGYFQHDFAVYGRTGEACPECNCDRMKTGCVKKIVQSGRSTFFCEERQI